jgi:glutamine amidotransferase
MARSGRAKPFVAVLDYGIGNIRSAQRALVAAGADARLVAEADQARGACGVVLPGVGAFGRCGRALRESGLDAVALGAIDAGRPFLGICVGMQLLYEGSEEAPDEPGLGVFGGFVRRLPEGTKRPQMQWNRLFGVSGRASAMLGVLEKAGFDEPWMYFVHSYAPEIGPETVAVCEYGGEVAAAAESGAIWATQFHPEKSSAQGLALLAGFVERCK